MRDRKININCIDKTIVVDGVGYNCPDMPETAEGTRAISWNPKFEKPGECESQDSHRFSDFGLIEPFLPFWQKRHDERNKAVKEAEERNAKAQKDFEKQLKQAEKDQKKAAAEAKKREKHDAALSSLYETDWKIIRAMEEKLAAEGAIDPDLVKERQKARDVVEKERKKL
jgi:hypothetical protein